MLKSCYANNIDVKQLEVQEEKCAVCAVRVLSQQALTKRVSLRCGPGAQPCATGDEPLSKLLEWVSQWRGPFDRNGLFPEFQILEFGRRKTRTKSKQNCIFLILFIELCFSLWMSWVPKREGKRGAATLELLDLLSCFLRVCRVSVCLCVCLSVPVWAYVFL